MKTYLKSILIRKTIFIMIVVCLISVLPAFCNDQNSSQESQREQSRETTGCQVSDTGRRILSDDPASQVAGGYYLCAVPVKYRFCFGEDILFKLTLTNVSQIDLKYGGTDTINIYYVTLYDFNGNIIPERHLERNGPNYGPSIFHPGESIDQKLCINILFNFTSPGIYTAKVWRYVNNLDDDKTAELCSNEFSFELYGNPGDAKKTYITESQPFLLKNLKKATIKPKHVSKKIQ